MSEHVAVPDAAEVSFYHVKGRWSGIFAWIFSTDHKRIGLMYLFLLLVFFALGAALGLLMRLELFLPGEQFLKIGRASCRERV